VTHFAISVDTPETNKAFAQAVAVDYPILSDPSRKVAAAYGVIDEDQPFPSRWTFYIGSDGRILFVDKQVTPTSHGKNVAAKLAELGIPRRRASQDDDLTPLFTGAANHGIQLTPRSGRVSATFEPPARRWRSRLN
jgi:alkyl hydroperoxide reductase subunit AhpC